MKIVSLVPSYNPNNEFVPQVIEELSKFSSVILFTTEDHTLPVSQSICFPKSVGRDLVYKTKEWVECRHLPQKYIYSSVNPTKEDITKHLL